MKRKIHAGDGGDSQTQIQTQKRPKVKRVRKLCRVVDKLRKRIAKIGHRAFAVGVSDLIAEYAETLPLPLDSKLRGSKVYEILCEPYPDVPGYLGVYIKSTGYCDDRHGRVFYAKHLRKTLDIYHPMDATAISISCKMSDGRTITIERNLYGHASDQVAHVVLRHLDRKTTSPGPRTHILSPDERARYTKLCTSFFKNAIRTRECKMFQFRGIFRGLVGEYSKYNVQYHKGPRYMRDRGAYMRRPNPKRLLYFVRWPSEAEAYALTILNPKISFGIPGAIYPTAIYASGGN